MLIISPNKTSLNLLNLMNTSLRNRQCHDRINQNGLNNRLTELYAHQKTIVYPSTRPV
jgi:hypothetical protein